MPTPTLVTLQDVITEVQSLALRLSAVDGQGLPDPSQGQIAIIQASFNGLKKTLQNVNLGYQTTSGSLQSQLATLQSAVYTALNIPQTS